MEMNPPTPIRTEVKRSETRPEAQGRGFNFLPRRSSPPQRGGGAEKKQAPAQAAAHHEEIARRKGLLPAQEEALKKEQLIKNIENKLMML